MLKEVGEFTREFLEFSQGKPVRIISHFDTDGVTSASILIKALHRLDVSFSVRIVKSLDAEIIKSELSRQPRETILFSDLASGSFDYFQDLEEPIFILDHHEPDNSKLNDNIKIINPHLTDDFKSNNCSGAGLCYLFAKELSAENKDLAKLAIIGMVGDRHEANLSKINKQIIEDCEELEIKRGLVIYPATRPLKRTLEYSTSPYIPGVSGKGDGAITLLKEANISLDKSLLDLNEDEMSRLVAGVMSRRAQNEESNDAVGNLYILKFFDILEDAREISTLINACSRLGSHDIAISYCLQNEKAKERALEIYATYRQELVSGLRVAEDMDKIHGKKFVILNAQDKIKDAIIGTICSMLSSSPSYEEGTVLIGMAYNENKIKVSARIAGQEGRNLKELMEKTIVEFKTDHPDSLAEVGGHEKAAGCFIEVDKEDHFIEKLKKNLEVEVIRV
jgi:single-stranded-DNA-specific exonuclease